MSEPYLSEIRIYGFNFPPRGWAQCDGQILPINQNQALFSLLGTTYGGDGRTSFALPDLRGRAPLHFDSGFTLGQRGGQETHTLSSAEIPGHTHALMATSDPGTQILPAGNLLGASASPLYHAADGSSVAMNPTAIANAGASQGHENRQPFQVLNFCIALQGVFPSRN